MARTEISALGRAALIEELTGGFEPRNAATVRAAGDDAAVIDCGGADLTLLTTDLLLEGIDFDLTYFPLGHLGYKAVVVGCGDIYAMGGAPRQMTLALGISAKLSVEQLKEFYDGVRAACGDCGADLAGGDIKPSLTGFSIAVTVLGSVEREKLSCRDGAREHDLICLCGDPGAAYMGLHLLEREKRALEGVADPKPHFEGYEYILGRYLRPRAQRDIVEALHGEGIVPGAMIDLSASLAAGLLDICRASGCGARIYLERIAIAAETSKMAAELNFDPVVAALHGGEDHLLLFTVPLAMRGRVEGLSGIDIIGHITKAGSGAVLVAPDGAEIPIEPLNLRQ